jgi:hypothetical protein
MHIALQCLADYPLSAAAHCYRTQLTRSWPHRRVGDAW